MPGVGPRLGTARRARLSLLIPPLSIDEDAATGAVVGVLGVRRGGGAWRFSLTDDAGGRFAIEGTALVKGAVPLSASAAPFVQVVIAAAGQARSLAAQARIAIRVSPRALLDEADRPLADQADFTITGV